MSEWTELRKRILNGDKNFNDILDDIQVVRNVTQLKLVVFALMVNRTARQNSEDLIELYQVVGYRMYRNAVVRTYLPMEQSEIEPFLKRIYMSPHSFIIRTYKKGIPEEFRLKSLSANVDALLELSKNSDTCTPENIHTLAEKIAILSNPSKELHTMYNAGQILINARILNGCDVVGGQYGCMYSRDRDTKKISELLIFHSMMLPQQFSPNFKAEPPDINPRVLRAEQTTKRQHVFLSDKGISVGGKILEIEGAYMGTTSVVNAIRVTMDLNA